MIKLVSIRIENMHGVQVKTYKFKDTNYLCGPNGAGKSTVLQAIQLALLGYIPGYSKNTRDIFKHANSHNMSVIADLHDTETNDFITIRRTWSTANGSVSSSTEIKPEGYELEGILANIELPIFNFNQFMNMSANQIKDWFMSIVEDSSGDIDWGAELIKAASHLGEISQDLIDNAVETAKSYESLPNIDIVRKMNDYFKQLRSLKSDEVDRLQSTLQMLTHYDDLPPLFGESEVEARIEELSALRDAVLRYVRVIEFNASIQEDIDQIHTVTEYAQDDPEYIEAKTRVAELQKQINAHHDKIAEAEKLRSEVSQQIMAETVAIAEIDAILSKDGICPYTNTQCESVVKLYDTLRDEKSEHEIAKGKLELGAEHAAVTIQDNMNAIEQLRSEMDTNTAIYSRIANEYARKGMLQSKLQEVPELPNGYVVTETSIDDLKAEISELTDHLIKLRANKEYDRLSSKVTSDLFNATHELEAIKCWVALTSVNGLQTKLAAEPFVNLSEKLDAWIQPLFGSGVETHFVVTEKANSFSFGLVTPDGYVEYSMLSSGEKCMYMLALMCCVVQILDPKLRLIIVDDAFDHLDNENTDTLFSVLSGVDDVQFIFAGVKELNPAYSEICMKVDV